jgi:hypothetical protein
MASLKGSWVWIDLSAAPSAADASQLVAKPVGVDGVVAEVWLSINTVLTTGGGIVTVHKTGAVNLLSATNVDLQSGLTAGTAASQVLTTATAALKVLSTDTLKAGWTLTTAAITNGFGCRVAIEPSYQ